jgi:hypothetical protein
MLALPPTSISTGLAEMPSIVGHRFSEPDTMTEPVRFTSLQAMDTMTLAVWPGCTLNVLEPLHVDDESVVVAASVIA